MHSVPCSLQTNLFSTLLEDALIKLNFLDVCNHDLRVYKTFAKIDHLRRAKYNVLPPKVKDDLFEIDPKKIDCDQFKTYKLDAERTTCTKILTDTYVELTLNQNFRPLAEYVQTTENLSAYSYFLEEDQTRNKNTRHELSRKLRHQKNHMKSALYDTDSIIQQLKSEVKGAMLIKMSEARFIDKWEFARSEQSALQIRKKEAGTSEAIAYYRQKFEEEFRVHAELERDCLKQVEEVMTKYDADIEAMDFKIEQMHSNYDDQLVRIRNLEETLASRQAEMESWFQFKKDRESECQYRMKMDQAAIIVQAWWRGLMTRLNLGRYSLNKKVLRKANKKK